MPFGLTNAPLTQLLKKGNFKWNPRANIAFEQLKKAMTKALVLALPDFTQQIIVECDAYGSEIGGVLTQNRRSIAFFSQTLHSKNLILSTYEKEMLL